MKGRKDYLEAMSIVLITVGALALLYVANALDIYTRVALAFVTLIISGISIQRAMKLNGGYGLYMIGSKKGLRVIDDISKGYKGFWNAMAMWGLTMGFGLLTYPMLKGRIDKRVFAFGVLSSILIVTFVQPHLADAFQFINIPGVQSTISGRTLALQQGANLFAYAITAVTVVFGFSGYAFISILANAALILLGHSQLPGVAPIIPGINLPLIAGLISLIVLLVIHEFSHGVLSRIAKVKLKSIGLLVFGIIPIGAFVEPDEKMVKKLGSTKQTKIFSAGIAANFIATVVFFVLMLFILSYVAPHAYQYGVVVTGTTTGYPANGILKSGMQILEWNNQRITNISDLIAAGAQDKPNSIISVATDSGTFMFRALPQPSNSSRGMIGVELGYLPIIKTPYARSVYFIYTLIALSMLLNFLVAVVNLLPIPGFDGWRIYKANIKSSRFVGFISALIVAGLVINALPWLFYI